MEEFILIDNKDCCEIQETGICIKHSYQVIHNNKNLAKIKLLTTISVQNEIRSPLDICLVVDTSMSTSLEKLLQIKKSLILLIEQLIDIDTVSIITYNDKAVLLVERCPVTMIGRLHLTHIVNNISHSGKTNLSSAIKLAITTLGLTDPLKDDTGLPYRSDILLISDGNCNLGITQNDILIKYIKNLIQKTGNNITIHTFGHGYSYTHDKLECISNNTGGSYYHVETVDNMCELFIDAIGIISEPVAKNTVICFQPNEYIKYNGDQVGCSILIPINNVARGNKVEKITYLSALSTVTPPLSVLLSVTLSGSINYTDVTNAVKMVYFKFKVDLSSNDTKNGMHLYILNDKLSNILNNYYLKSDNTTSTNTKLDNLEKYLTHTDSVDIRSEINLARKIINHDI